MKLQKDSCIKWLHDNDYKEVVQLIEELMNRWKREGNKQRRNWWEVLAGGKNGVPKVINGVTFPVLKIAQLRMRKDVTPNAISKNKKEQLPPERVNNRWK